MSGCGRARRVRHPYIFLGKEMVFGKERLGHVEAATAGA